MLNLNFRNGNTPALNARNLNAIVEAINTMQTQLANPFTFKGSVSAVSNLPSSGNTVNDTYYVTAATCLYTWDGNSWEVSSLSESDYLADLSRLDSSVLRYNVTNVLSYGNRISASDYYGITTVWDTYGNCTITGTNTQAVGIRMWPPTESFPEWLEKGNTYYVTNPAENVRLQIVSYDSESTIISEFISADVSGKQTYTIPNNTETILIQLRILPATHNETVYPEMLNGISESDAAKIMEAVLDNVDDLLQYNILNVLSEAIRNNVSNYYGITATWNADGSCTITGTNTQAVGIRMWLNTDELPKHFVPGGEYYLKYSSDNIQFNAVFYDSESQQISNVLAASDALITVPANTISTTLQLRIPPGTHNETVNPFLLTDVSSYIYQANNAPLSVNVTSSGVEVTEGDLKVVLVKNGYNSLINFRNATWEGTSLFYVGTDWIGPYDFTAVNNADGDRLDPSKGVRSTNTTGGNHNIHTGDPATGTPTARTIRWKAYADEREVTQNGTVKCSTLRVEWVNRVQAGNTAKLDKDSSGYGTGRECLEEHCFAEFCGGGLIRVGVDFLPLEEIKMNWYSGLQFSGSGFAPDIYIPEYSNTPIGVGYVNDYWNSKVVRYMTALGSDMNLEMYLDRDYGCGENEVPHYVSGGNNGVGTKVYFILFSREQSPVTMTSGERYAWRGHYRFRPTV